MAYFFDSEEVPTLGSSADAELQFLQELFFDDEVQTSQPGTHEYVFDDIRVRFPYEAYESQLLMMEKVILGLKNGQNCLLESPTGTGKTAALLCSILAWKQECNRHDNNGDKSFRAPKEGSCSCDFDRIVDDRTTYETYDDQTRKLSICGRKKHISSESEGSSDDSQQPQQKLRKNDNDNMQVLVEKLCKYCQCKYVTPRIIYATRTHSQITQVVNQLKQTVYNSMKMTILASRSQTCINPIAKGHPTNSVDDMCSDLRELKTVNEDGKLSRKCPFYREDKRNFFDFPPSTGNTGLAFDLEDIIKAGKDRHACPYYGCRELKGRAEILFCPYNYLLYPYLLRPSGIKLENSVVVFDEAHNIEDICRDAASQCISLDEVNNKVRLTFDEALIDHEIPEILRKLCMKYSLVFNKMSTWIKDQEIKIGVNRDFYGHYVGTVDLSRHFVQVFESFGFIDKDMNQIKEDINAFYDRENYVLNPATTTGKNPMFKMKKDGIRFLNRLWWTLRKLYKGDSLQHYKTVLVKKSRSSVRKRFNIIPKEYEMELHIICLNPAIMFSFLKRNCRTIIVASGTLSPIDSFSTELDTEFRQTLQAPHVVDDSKVVAHLVTVNPFDQSRLSFSSEAQSSTECQDHLGRMILSICQVIPNGVLVFLSSYGFMGKLVNRWTEYPTENPIMLQLKRTKHLFFETSNPEKFKNNMIKYRELVHQGCAFFGVFRGKISEGVDFKDEQARAVISVGIPFPPVSDPNIKYKKEYNEKMRILKPKFLSANEWYNAQAFRAINQGFGRCIRHKDDWGVVLILDERIYRHKSQLSHWIKQFLKVSKNFDETLLAVSNFLSSKTFRELPMQLESQPGQLALGETELPDSMEISFGNESEFSEGNGLPLENQAGF